MIGRMEFVSGERGRGEGGSMYGLPVLLVKTDPEGWLGERRLLRAGRTLKRGGVARTILPPDFSRWELLRKLGLRGVEPAPLLRACAPALTERALRERDVDPRKATVTLFGTRADGEMLRCAAGLCARVRRLVVDAPGGEKLALRLREEFGLPVLPPEHPAQLELRFQPREGTGNCLELFGRNPALEGLHLAVPELAREDQTALDVLCVLWERGLLDPERIKIHRN